MKVESRKERAKRRRKKESKINNQIQSDTQSRRQEGKSNLIRSATTAKLSGFASSRIHWHGVEFGCITAGWIQSHNTRRSSKKKVSISFIIQLLLIGFRPSQADEGEANERNASITPMSHRHSSSAISRKRMR